MIRTSTLPLAMAQLAEARETLAALANLRPLGIGAMLRIMVPGQQISTGPGEYEAAQEQELFLPVEAVRDALRARLRTLADQLAKAGLAFDEGAEELGKAPRQRAKPGTRKPRQLAAPKQEAVA